MPSTLLLRRRIRSIKNTHKITRAMELVASAKMKKAQDGVLASRPYARETSAMLDRLIPQLQVAHQLLTPRPHVKTVTLVIFSSDRGLCGSFNVNVLRQSMQAIKTIEQGYPGAKIEWVAMGRKVRDALRRVSTHPLFADYPKPDRPVHFADTVELRTLLLNRYLAGDTDRVVLVYTDFVSALVQKAKMQQLLPFPQLDQEVERSRSEEMKNNDYLLEPSADRLVEALLPPMVDLELYQALLESTASEHAARRMAMKNATEAASDIIDDLSLEYNQTRQAGITQEIAEISTATAAMAG
ncbi:ATP synthase F1 subunit gamma [Candidatus Uhrbacteria bacterium]|nr:ATP synthase F1 subunit gamma [Candidatus Uhrbacteria bacterium]